MNRKTLVIFLCATIIFAGGLRFLNYDFDAGKELYYDSHDKVRQAQGVAEGDLLPKNWKQPYFLVYSSGSLIAGLKALGVDDFDSYERAVTTFMVLLSLGTMLLTYRITYLVFNDQRASLLAMFAFAVVPISVVGARYIKEDIPVMFWSNVALLFIILSVRSRKRKYYLLAGLSIGWAFGTKLSATTLVPIFLLAHLLNRSDRKQAGEHAAWHLPLALLLIPVGFLMFNPAFIAHIHEAMGGIDFQVGYSSRGHHDGTVIGGWDYWWTFYLAYALIPGITLPLTVACLGGGILVAVKGRHNRLGLLLLAWVVIGYVVCEASLAKPFPFFARYLHPQIPAFLAVGAYFLSFVYENVRARFLGRALWFLGVAAILMIPCVKSILIVSGSKEDTRSVASQWINRNLPRGSRLCLDDWRYSPHPQSRRFSFRYPRKVYTMGFSKLKSRFDYVVLNSFRYDRYSYSHRNSVEARTAYEFYTRCFNDLDLVKEFRPRWEIQTYGFHNPIIRIYRIPRERSSGNRD